MISELLEIITMASMPNIMDDLDLSSSSTSEEGFTLHLSDDATEPESALLRLRQAASPVSVAGNAKRREEATAALRTDYQMSDEVRKEKEDKIKKQRADKEIMMAARQAALDRKRSQTSVSLK